VGKKRPILAKMAKKAKKGEKCPFWAVFGILGVLGGFSAPGGLPDPLLARGFTSTPRAGAPRYPGGRGRENAPPRRGVPSGGGAGGLPLGERSVGPVPRGPAVADLSCKASNSLTLGASQYLVRKLKTPLVYLAIPVPLPCGQPRDRPRRRSPPPLQIRGGSTPTPPEGFQPRGPGRALRDPRREPRGPAARG